jgi:hypothetical protein
MDCIDEVSTGYKSEAAGVRKGNDIMSESESRFGLRCKPCEELICE